MKKKIALVLAAAMTISMLPMNAFAASSNSLSRTGTTVREDEKVLNNNLPVTLDIKPTSEVLSNESIILTVANGKFDESLMSVEHTSTQQRRRKVLRLSMLSTSSMLMSRLAV